MVENIKIWWRNHSVGEQWLMAFLIVAILIVVLWLGILRPVSAALESGWQRQNLAIDRLASVRSKVDALKKLSETQLNEAPLPVEQIVGQTAAEAGFTLDRVGAQGAGRMSVSIGAARMQPLMNWISSLEQSGVVVQTITIVPGVTAGTVSVQAVLLGKKS